LAIVSPDGRVAASEYHPAPDFHSICEVNFMSGRDDAAVTEQKYGIDLVDDVGIGNGVDLVQPNDLAVPSQTHFFTAADDIQVTNAHVIVDREFLNAHDDVEMTHLHVVVNVAFAGVDDADTDANSFADLVSETEAINWAFEERRQNRAYRQHQQTQFAWFVHRSIGRIGPIGPILCYRTNCRLSSSAVALST